MSQTLEQIFTALGIAPDALQQARQRQANEGGSLRENLIALNRLTADEFSDLVSKRFRMPYLNPKETSMTDEALGLLPRDKAERYRALPLVFDSKYRRLSITLADPSDMLALDELKFIIGHTLIPQYTPEDELLDALKREYRRFEESQAVAAAWNAEAQPGSPTDARFPTIDVAALASGDAMTRLVAAMFTEAYARRAGEMLLAPQADGLHLFFRLQRLQTPIAVFPVQLAAPLFSRLRRVLLGDAGDRSGPIQHGTAVVKLENKKELDLSYMIYPTVQHEELCIKFKDRYHLPVLSDFSLLPDAQAALQQALDGVHGIVLVTGAAKHGVSTTLYALLNTLYAPHLNIVSIENPIELLIDGITQGAVRADAGQTYTDYLHYAMHQRPDVLMLDRVPAPELFPSLAVVSAGSLVLTSFPALDTASALMKLRLLTSPTFVVNHITCVTAQRLVRTICDSCKEEIDLPAPHRRKLGFGPDDRCYAGKGCDRCEQTGYMGITPIFEVVRMTDPLHQALSRSDSAADVRSLLSEQGVSLLRDDGMRKVKAGVTTIQEVLKATML